MNQYNPHDWYWKSSAGKIYSSRQQALIKEDDADYKSWLDAGNLPTPWPTQNDGEETDAMLQSVLDPYNIRLFKPTLDEYKVEAQGEIDRAAEIVRLQYITDGVGQSMTYTEKVSQAQTYSGAWAAYLANPDTSPKPNDDEFLLLKASLEVDGDTLLEVAETVTYAYLQWQQIGAAIEEKRLKAKLAVSTAKTQAAVQKIMAGLNWTA